MQNYDTISISANQLPETVNQLAKPIENLSAKGNVDILNTGVRVGIVGARKFTTYGKKVTTDFTTELTRAGVTIVSGLALGVDSIAHRACIDAGGKTIAVLPSGLEKIYPANHRNLANQILQSSGCLISEYPPKHTPMRYDFLARNRIVASLSDVLLVTEAALASGTMHTVGYALELGVTVMAVPGNIDQPISAGTNKLIQNGAYPALSAQDILDHLGIKPEEKAEYLPENEFEQKILECLKSESPTTLQLVASSGLKLNDLQTHLTMLEIKGVIEASSGIWHIK